MKRCFLEHWICHSILNLKYKIMNSCSLRRLKGMIFPDFVTFNVLTLILIIHPRTEFASNLKAAPKNGGEGNDDFYTRAAYWYEINSRIKGLPIYITTISNFTLQQLPLFWFDFRKFSRSTSVSSFAPGLERPSRPSKITLLSAIEDRNNFIQHLRVIVMASFCVAQSILFLESRWQNYHQLRILQLIIEFTKCSKQIVRIRFF